MKHLIAALAFMAFAGSVCAQPPEANYSTLESTEIELANVRALFLERNPELVLALATGDNMTIATALRDTVHHSVVRVNSDPTYAWGDLDHFVWQSFYHPGWGHICDGLAMTLSIALKAFDVPHRAVSMFDQWQNYDQGNNHVSVEVIIGGRWIAMDPTFSAVWQNAEGWNLSWYEIRQDCRAGTPPTAVYSYRGHRPGDGAEDYYETVCNLSEFLGFSQGQGGGFSTYPPEWDGVVHASTGATDDTERKYTMISPWHRVLQ